MSEQDLSVIANTNVFKNESIKEMKYIMHKKKVAKNELIFLEGEQSNKLFFIFNGTVQLAKLSNEGKNIVLHYFFPNDLFGEFNPKQTHTTPFTAHSLDGATIGVIYESDFKELIQNNSDIAMEFSQWQSHMRRFTQYKFRDLLFYGKDGALASTLLRAANTYGKQKQNHTSITRNFTNNELADIVGTSRETINRILSAFKKDNIISSSKGQVTIHDESALRKLCNCEQCMVDICRL